MSIIVEFCGTDGAGKSTQIDRVRNTLLKYHYKTESVWARGGYTPVFSWVKRSARMLTPSGLPQPGPSVERTRKFESTVIRRLWLSLAILDLMVFYGLWLRILRWRNGYILCDRFIEDTLLDFERNFPQEEVASWWLWRILVWAVPRPEYRFLLLVPPETSINRSAEKNEPFPDSVETLEWRYSRYLEIAELDGWCVLDGREPIDIVHDRIIQKLGICE